MEYEYLVDTAQPLGQIFEMAEWAADYCPSYIWREVMSMPIHTDRQGNMYYRFRFTNEKDLVFFKLRWS